MNAMVCGGWREAATNKHLLSSEKYMELQILGLNNGFRLVHVGLSGA